MGIADRDWYRDKGKARGRGSRNSRSPFGVSPAFARQSSLAARVMTSCAAVLIIAVLGVKAYGWWQLRESRQALEDYNPTPSVLLLPEETDPATDHATRYTRQRPDAAAGAVPPPQTREVFKCIVNGRVIYSGPSDCRGGMASAISITPAPDGVPEGLSEYQREMLRSADARIARDRAAAGQPQSADAQGAVSTRRAQCIGLDQQIRSLDAQSRNALSGQQHDSLRSARMQLTSRQSALRC